MNIKCALPALFCALALSSPIAQAQTTTITTEYLMTLYAPLEAPQAIDNTLNIYNLREGGWARGPKIEARMIAPAADWLRVMPGGNLRLDVRGTLQTADGALIYISYNGVISQPPELFERFTNGEVLKADEIYFLTAPTFQTSAEKYAWLNHVQCVGKMVEVKAGEDSYVKYDIFVVR
jgi:hypothetical protein